VMYPISRRTLLKNAPLAAGSVANLLRRSAHRVDEIALQDRLSSPERLEAHFPAARPTPAGQ